MNVRLAEGESIVIKNDAVGDARITLVKRNSGGGYALRVDADREHYPVAVCDKDGNEKVSGRLTS